MIDPPPSGGRRTGPFRSLCHFRSGRDCSRCRPRRRLISKYSFLFANTASRLTRRRGCPGGNRCPGCGAAFPSGQELPQIGERKHPVWRVARGHREPAARGPGAPARIGRLPSELECGDTSRYSSDNLRWTGRTLERRPESRTFRCLLHLFENCDLSHAVWKTSHLSSIDVTTSHLRMGNAAS